MSRPNGIHHLAISTANIKAQIEYFSDVLGLKLVALYWMHGVPGAWHGFMHLNDRSSIAFVQIPEIGKIPVTIGVTHAGSAAAPSAPGTMQHIALNVDSEEELLTLRDRVRSHGIHVFGPIDHGFCKSIYFAGLENLALEIATSKIPIDARQWIDPEVIALAGISADELARYRNPAAYTGQQGAVAQPPYDATKPHLTYPDAQRQILLSISDEQLSKRLSQPEPPVKLRET